MKFYDITAIYYKIIFADFGEIYLMSNVLIKILNKTSIIQFNI